MRGCLGLIVLSLVMGVTAWFVLPAALDAAATASVSGAGFNGTNTSVRIEASPAQALSLHADALAIHSTNATFHELQMAAVDVTLRDIGLLDRTFASIDGTLTGVHYQQPGGWTFQASEVTVSWARVSARLDIRLSPADVRAVASSVGQASLGAAPSQVVLSAPDRISLTLGSQTIAGRLSMDSQGGLDLVPGTGAGSSIALLRPTAGLPLKLRSFEITAGGLDVIATIDLRSLG